MDRVLPKKPRKMRWAISGFCIVFLFGLSVFLLEANPSVTKADISTATVFIGAFEETIPVRATVAPLHTTYVDTVVAGRIESILVKEGDEVIAGQPILRLANTRLQLEFISKEAQVTEQLNNLRNTKLAMEKDLLDLRREMIEVEYNIKKLEREARQKKMLRKQGAISQDEVDQTLELLTYYKRRKELISLREKTQKALRSQQLAQLDGSVKRLSRSLDVASSILEHLTVRAPQSGILTSLTAEVGQYINQGERLGQIDGTSGHRLTALISEYYLEKVSVGTMGTANIDSNHFPVRVTKVYPEVANGTFRIELEFANTAELPRLRRGQTVNTVLNLSRGKEVLQIARKGILRDPNIDIVYVLAESGDYAVRRRIRLGRSNSRYVEVLDGLRSGDKVVVSGLEGTKESRIDLVGE